MLIAAGQIAPHSHAQGCGERGARVAGAIAIVVALGAQHEAVQSARLANGIESIATAGEVLVNVGLMADIEDELVCRRIKDHVEGECEFDDTEIGTEVPTRF